MIPHRQRSSWKIIAAVLVATALGGAFVGFQSGGGFRDTLAEAVTTWLKGSTENELQNLSDNQKLKRDKTAKLDQEAPHDDWSPEKRRLVDALKRRDFDALDRLLPQGITGRWYLGGVLYQCVVEIGDDQPYPEPWPWPASVRHRWPCSGSWRW
jgi:hypothetical protein